MVGFSILTASKEELDAAKRLSDIVNSLVIAYPLDQVVRSWIAVKLQDGSTDGNLYDSRREAVRHQTDEFLCAYVCLREAPGGMGTGEAYAFLAYHRGVYDAGYRLPDPDHHNGGFGMVTPLAIEDFRSQVRRLRNRKAS